MNDTRRVTAVCLMRTIYVGVLGQSMDRIREEDMPTDARLDELDDGTIVIIRGDRRSELRPCLVASVDVVTGTKKEKRK